MPLPTLASILALPEMQRGEPEVLTGTSQLDRPVRWVHVSELPDIAELVRGGELILSTGIGLVGNHHDQARYIRELAEVPVAGLVIELGKAFSRVPRALVDAAQAHDLPLISLSKEVPFISITEVAHGMIVDAGMRELHAIENIRRVLTELSVEGATAQQVVSRVAMLTGCTSVFEDHSHRVLAFQTGDRGEDEEALSRWDQLSRSLEDADAEPDVSASLIIEATPEGNAGWTAQAVQARGDRWGRLVVRTGSSISPAQRAALECGASALALLHVGRNAAIRQLREAHGALFDRVMEARIHPRAELQARAEALGIPVRGRVLVPLCLFHAPNRPSDPTRPRPDAHEVSRIVDDCAAITGVAPLTSHQEPGCLAVLAFVPKQFEVASVVRRTAQLIEQRLDSELEVTVTIGLGPVVQRFDHVRAAFGDARQAAEAGLASGSGAAIHELSDLRLRALLYGFRDEPRLHSFVERELGALLAQEPNRSRKLIASLHAYLESGGNKSATAAALWISRPTLYQRLSAIEELLGRDLDAPSSRVSLHVALLALEALRPNDFRPWPDARERTTEETTS